jgi:hypothetical protein
MRCGVAAWRIPSRDTQTTKPFPFVEDVVNENDHPRDEEIAAFLDDGLSASERTAIARHLASCDDCRALLGAPMREQPRRGRGTQPLWLSAAAVAAAAVVLFKVAVPSTQPTIDVDHIRGSATAPIEKSELDGQSPVAGSDVSVDTIVFRWSSAGPGATYDVTIVDDAGVVLWNSRIDSVGIAPPRDVTERLRAGRTYYWRVDALLPDLRTASTGPQGFIPAPR